MKKYHSVLSKMLEAHGSPEMDEKVDAEKFREI